MIKLTVDEFDRKVKKMALKLYAEKGIKLSCERCYYEKNPKCPDFPHICEKVKDEND